MKLSFVLLLASFILSLVFCAVEIPVLRRLKTGQNILSYVKEHQNKGGTPTMGGLGFTFAALVVAITAYRGADKPFWVTVAVGLSYLLVGFLDDFLKKRHEENLGLTAKQKLFFQFAVALVSAYYCYQSGLSTVYLPFTRRTIELSFWIIPLGVLVFLATVNSVNLTDGLDGLAGSVSGVYFLVFALLVSLQGGSPSLTGISLCLSGALGGYLVFNTNRASVFMGDTGSLALGGFAACVALFSGNALLLPFVGGMFVLSSISVIVQVIYYKKTGKRVFLMAPIHHHFQQKGYSEGKIVYAYSVLTAVLGVLVLLPFV